MRHISKISSAAILALALNGPAAQALEKWEGTDDFGNATGWYEWVKRGPYGEMGRLYNSMGRLIFSASVSHPEYGTNGAWLWGQRSGSFRLPANRSWEIRIEAVYPETAPEAGIDEAGFGLYIIWYSGKGDVLRGVGGRLLAPYNGIGNSLAEPVKVETGFNGTPGDGALIPEDVQSIPKGSGSFEICYRHNALNRMDTFQVSDLVADEVVYDRTANSPLASFPWCAAGLAMGVEENARWPGSLNNLAMDNWSLLAFDPDPIDLNPQSGTVKGVAYTVAVTGLGMTGPDLNGTVSLTVGSSSASLPIRGIIDRAGRLSLRASGTGAQKGFGCTLGYDVVSGVFTPNKNSVTAPGQKPIKF